MLKYFVFAPNKANEKPSDKPLLRNALNRLRRKSVKKLKKSVLRKFPCLTTRGRSLEIFSRTDSVFSFLSFSGGSFWLLFPAVGKK